MDKDQRLEDDLLKAVAKYRSVGGSIDTVIDTLRRLANRFEQQPNFEAPRPKAKPGKVQVKQHERDRPSRAERRAMRERIAKRVRAETSAKTLFDTYMVADGRPIGGIAWRELPAIARKGSVDAAVCMAVYNHALPANPDTVVRELVDETFLAAAVKTAKTGGESVAAA